MSSNSTYKTKFSIDEETIKQRKIEENNKFNLYYKLHPTLTRGVRNYIRGRINSAILNGVKVLPFQILINDYFNNQKTSSHKWRFKSLKRIPNNKKK